MKRLIHTFKDHDDFFPICGVPRDHKTGIIINPADLIAHTPDYQDDLFRMCKKCYHHPDLPMLLLGAV